MKSFLKIFSKQKSIEKQAISKIDYSKSSIPNLDRFNKSVLYEHREEQESQNQTYLNQNTCESYQALFKIDKNPIIQKFVGRIVSIFDKKPRTSLKTQQKSDQEIVLSGTATFIGQNLLCTSAHNLFIREFNQLASSVHFFPAALNKQGQPAFSIQAKVYKAYPAYSDPACEYHNKYDIALVVLENNQFFSNQNVLNIQWTYKRWQHNDKNLTICGYPFKRKVGKQWTFFSDTKASTRQQSQQIYYYHETSSGVSGGPLIKFSEDKGQLKVTSVGLHKGETARGRFGITFNTLPSTQEAIFQLCESLKAQSLFSPHYKISTKKLREASQNVSDYQINQINVLKNRIKQLEAIINKLQKENYNLKKGFTKDEHIQPSPLQQKPKVKIEKNNKNHLSAYEKLQDIQNVFKQINVKMEIKQLTQKEEQQYGFYDFKKINPNQKIYSLRLNRQDMKKSKQISQILNQRQPNWNTVILDLSFTFNEDMDKYQKVQQSIKFISSIHNLQNINLSDNKINAKWMDRFVEQSAFIGKIRTLIFSNNQIKDQGFHIFSQKADKFKNLTFIDFGENQIGHQGISNFVQQSSSFKNLKKIDLRCNIIDAYAFCEFCRGAADFQNLTQIIFSDNSIKCQGFKFFITKAKNFKNLTTIDFSCNQITAEGFKEFANQGAIFKNLVKIYFSSNSIRDDGIKMFAKKASYFKNLTLIDFSHNQIHDQGFIAFSSKASSLPNLKEIYFSGNQIGSEGFKAFSSQAVNFGNLKIMDFSRNQIDDDSIKYFSLQSSGFKSLNKINFRNNSISDVGFQVFSVKSGGFKSLNNIDFTNNKIGVHGFKYFSAQAVNFKNLTEMNFGNNKIGNDGFKAFTAQAIHFKNLIKIRFNNNNIGDEGFISFALQSIHFKKLKEIIFYENNIGSEGLKRFSEQAYNLINLNMIQLSENKIGDEGLKIFLSNAHNFKKLDTIYLNNNQITSQLRNQVLQDKTIKFQIGC